MQVHSIIDHLDWAAYGEDGFGTMDSALWSKDDFASEQELGCRSGLPWSKHPEWQCSRSLFFGASELSSGRSHYTQHNNEHAI